MKRLTLLTVALAAAAAMLIWLVRRSVTRPTITSRAAPHPGSPGSAGGTPTSVDTSSKAAPGDDLTTITGIGPAYRNRLHAAGVTTFAELAAADPAAVAKATGRNEHLVRDWVEQARDRTT